MAKLAYIYQVKNVHCVGLSAIFSCKQSKNKRPTVAKNVSHRYFDSRNFVLHFFTALFLLLPPLLFKKKEKLKQFRQLRIAHILSPLFGSIKSHKNFVMSKRKPDDGIICSVLG